MCSKFQFELFRPARVFHLFSFDNLAKPFSRNSSVLTFIQNPGGGGSIGLSNQRSLSVSRVSPSSVISIAYAHFTQTVSRENAPSPIFSSVYAHLQKQWGVCLSPASSFPSVSTCYNPRVPSDQIELLVPLSDSGIRLDRFVAACCPGLSRSRIQELIDSALVLVNGKSAKPSQKLKGNERITVHPEPRAPLRAEAESIPLEILYEDNDLIVINKPAGMTVHAGAGNSRGTLVNALLGRGQSLSQSTDLLRPGIVHRLDKDTSGAILIAKNDFAHAKLAEAFRARAIEKTYIALVQGKLTSAQGRIELSISRDPKRRVRMSARSTNKSATARYARTDWSVLQEFGPATLVQVQLHTGRTHQIRVHFSALNHPVVGDSLYGAASQLTVHKTKLPVLGRQFLHAARLSFAHPRTQEKITVAAPLAPELKIYLEKLAAAAGVPKIDASLAASL